MTGWLEGLHVALDVVGTVASVVPGAGTAVAFVAEGVNTTIYLAEAAVASTPEARRAALTQASISAVGMIPGTKLAKAASKGLAKVTKGTKAGEKIASAMAIGQRAADKVTDMKNVVRSTKTVQAIETTVKKGLSKPAVGAVAKSVKNVVESSEKVIAKLPGGKRIVQGTNAAKKAEAGTLASITKRRDKVPPKLLGALGDVRIDSRDGRAIQAILSSEKAISRKSAAALGKNIVARRSQLIKTYGPDAFRFINKLEAEYYRLAAASSLVHFGVPLMRNLGTMSLKKALPVLDIRAGLVNYAWDRFAPLEGMNVADARSEQSILLRQLVREGSVGVQGARESVNKVLDVDVDVDVDELLFEVLLKRVIEECQGIAENGVEQPIDEEEALAGGLPPQWPSLDRQVYDFLTQMAGFLPPEYAPIAGLVLKIGGVTAGLDELTPEGLISTLLPFIKDPTVQKVVGTALKVRALQNQVAALETALKAGTATTAAQLATLQSAMSVISTVLSLIPGIPPEVTQAAQLVTAALQLAQLLSAAAPPLMVLSALASIIQLGMGFGFGGRSKTVPGGTNNSGTGAPHNKPGGSGPSVEGEGRLPGAGGRGLSAPDGSPIDAPSRDSRGNGPSMWVHEGNNEPDAYERRAGGSDRVAGGINDHAVQSSAGQEMRRGRTDRLPPSMVEELMSRLNHVSNSLGRGDMMTSFEDETRQLTQELPEVAESIEQEARRQMGLPPLRGMVDGTMDVESEDMGIDSRAALHESFFPDIDDILNRRARGEGFDGPREMTDSEPMPGDETDSDIFEDPGEHCPDPILSGDVSAAVASELALLGDKETEDIFWAKLINSSLVSQSLVQNELLEAAEREEEEVRQREAEAERQRQKQLQEEAEARERHNQEHENSITRAERERMQERCRKAQERTATRLMREAEVQKQYEKKKAQERARRAPPPQRSTHKRKDSGGCSLI